MYNNKDPRARQRTPIYLHDASTCANTPPLLWGTRKSAARAGGRQNTAHAERYREIWGFLAFFFFKDVAYALDVRSTGERQPRASTRTRSGDINNIKTTTATR